MSARRRGFTLIEVMIAVVILAIGMSSLFTSEAGAVRIAQRARTTTVASLLARCKMGEIEERVAKEGWPGEQIDGRDACCEEAEHEGFRCDWKVERITLPEIEEEGETGGATAGGMDKEKGESGSSLAPGAGAGSLLSDAGIDTEGGILGNIMSSLGEGSGGGDPIAAMAMSIAFPIMKPVIEEGVRRVTVTISWKEGDSEQTFDVVQFLVNELPMLPTEDQAQSGATGGGTGGTTGGGGGNPPGAPPARPPGGIKL